MAYDNEGKIDSKMFSYALSTFGDKMTKAEIDDVFGEFDIDEDYNIKTKEVIGMFVAVKEEEKEEAPPPPVEEEAPAEDEGEAKKKKKKKKKPHLHQLRKKPLQKMKERPRRRRRRRRRLPSKRLSYFPHDLPFQYWNVTVMK